MFSISSYAQNAVYWVGGSGDWTDTNHWVKNSGGSNITGEIPNEDYIVIIDGNSGLNSGSTITIPPGEYSVHDLIVTNTSGFTLLFNGTSISNDVEMNIFGDLDLPSNLSVEFTSLSTTSNAWRFVDNTFHTIHTRNTDLINVELVSAGASYSLNSHYTTSVQTRMYGGTWNTNGRTVNAGKLLFNDGINPPQMSLTKIFNAGSSTINCDSWDSRLTYGSLTVTGNHFINTAKFVGSPVYQGNQFSFYEIRLLEYPDNPTGGSIVEHNNFECTDCLIENLIIEDTGRTKLAGKFTINGKLTVVNEGVSVEFSGGNGRSNQVTLNGIVVTPSVNGCDQRTVFKNVHNDFTSLMRSSGTLTISNAVLENIQASGGAGTNFILSNGVLQGSSTGWSLQNTPNAVDYLWFSPNGVQGDWDDPTNWMLVGGGSNGCVPSIVDDVHISDESKGDIRIPPNYTAECRDFLWTNKDGITLTLDGTSSLKSVLKVTGDFYTDPSANFVGANWHEVSFSSATNNAISANDVLLPDVSFSGDDGEWNLESPFSADEIEFIGGQFNSAGEDVTTDYWSCIEENPKHFVFNSSHIVVNGEMALSRTTNSGVTVSAGTSLITCEKLTSTVTNLYDVQLNNASSRTLDNYAYNFNSLILKGIGQVNTQNDLTVKDLVFEANGSSLALDMGEVLTINGGIISNTSSGNPGILKSRVNGTQVDIDKVAGNICVLGYVSFEDINAALSGVFNAPLGIDAGNNTDINYDNGTSTSDLYWIGESGSWLVNSNWSRVDGGCPSTKDPKNAPNLYFTSNSFSTSPATVTVPSATTANDVHFLNSDNLTVNVTINLTPNNIYVNGGYANFTGKLVTVLGSTTVQSSGFLTTDMTNTYRTNELESSGGAVIVRSGSYINVLRQ
ncbi:hypothetical protein GCM10007940_16040 [Portibacter lacus]|uniref:Uncharacterized protein n=2 Tax=Portibacter lacus TaxID=1099794 RepID=A0AA37SPV6_9BACT|nr:hypothetical protein GCM10007940_16040 [Portibacter lacus]